MIDGAKTVCCRPDPTTARSARALALKKRARLRVEAPITEKNTNHPPGRNPVELLDRAARLVASRGGQVDHGADAAQGVAEGLRVREVPESDLDAHALGAQATRVADEAADGLAMRGQAPQEGRAHHAGGTREQDHGRRSLGAAGTEPGGRTA